MDEDKGLTELQATAGRGKIWDISGISYEKISFALGKEDPRHADIGRIEKSV